jgi:plastocyanin
MRLFALVLAALSLAAPAFAADLSVSLKAPNGRPVANAVVTVKPQAGTRAPIRFGWPYRMAQKNMQFDPFVLIVPVGAEVTFPNLDPFRHHVYSFSPAKVFELKLYSRDQTRAVRFDKPGVVALGCNIHDDMSAFIRVVDTPFAGKTGASGDLVLRDLPAGPAVVTVWHPYAKSRGGEVTRPIVVPANGGTGLALTLDLRAPPVMRGMY